MTLAWHVIELACVYIVLAGILAFAVLTVFIELWGTPKLLDGRSLQSALDDSDRRRMLIAHNEADRAPDLFAFALEEIRNLPERRHP